MKKEKRITGDLSALNFGKVPPQATEVEAAVLGACMLEADVLSNVMEVLPTGDCFYKDSNQKIYECMLRLHRDSLPVDFLTVTNELEKSGELELIGGRYYLMQLGNSINSTAHTDTHAKLIAEKYMQREVIRISGTLITEAYNGDADVFDLIDNASGSLTNLTSSICRKDPIHISRVAFDQHQRMDKLAAQGKEIIGIPSDLRDLDVMTKGWQEPDLIILAARPSVGKTAFSINLLVNAAKNGYPGALFSLEMGAGQIYNRMLAAEAMVEMAVITNPSKATADELRRMAEGRMAISKLPLYIDDEAGLTSIQLRAKARKLKNKGLKFIIVDYLQLMEGWEKGMIREQVVAKNSRDLKKLAKDLEVPIIALSQMSRGIEAEKNRLPQLSDLRESGAIEQDADIVMFLCRPPEDMLRLPEWSGKMLLKIAKGRNIGIGEIPLEFNPVYQKWKDAGGYKPPDMSNNSALQSIGRQYQQPRQLPIEKEDLPF